MWDQLPGDRDKKWEERIVPCLSFQRVAAAWREWTAGVKAACSRMRAYMRHARSRQDRWRSQSREPQVSPRGGMGSGMRSRGGRSSARSTTARQRTASPRADSLADLVSPLTPPSAVALATAAGSFDIPPSPPDRSFARRTPTPPLPGEIPPSSPKALPIPSRAHSPQPPAHAVAEAAAEADADAKLKPSSPPPSTPGPLQLQSSPTSFLNSLPLPLALEPNPSSVSRGSHPGLVSPTVASPTLSLASSAASSSDDVYAPFRPFSPMPVGLHTPVTAPHLTHSVSADQLASPLPALDLELDSAAASGASTPGHRTHANSMGGSGSDGLNITNNAQLITRNLQPANLNRKFT